MWKRNIRKALIEKKHRKHILYTQNACHVSYVLCMMFYLAVNLITAFMRPSVDKRLSDRQKLQAVLTYCMNVSWYVINCYSFVWHVWRITDCFIMLLQLCLRRQQQAARGIMSASCPSGSSAVVYLSVSCPSVNSYFSWHDISVLSGWISMKLDKNIHHESRHCWKGFHYGNTQKRKVLTILSFLEHVRFRGKKLLVSETFS